MLSFCIIFCIAFSSILSFYADTSTLISSNTIITNENIKEVLNYLSIESSNFIPNNNNNVKNSIKTVGE